VVFAAATCAKPIDPLIGLTDWARRRERGGAGDRARRLRGDALRSKECAAVVAAAFGT